MRRTATRARCWPVLEPFRALPQCYRIRPVILLVRSGAVAYLVAVYATIDPDDFELRWPPQLFIDEAKRLRSRKGSSDWMSDVEWLLTDAFVSTEPAEVFSHLSSGAWGEPKHYTEHEQWLSQLIREAATWPEPGTRKPYWSTRAGSRTSPARRDFDQVTRS